MTASRNRRAASATVDGNHVPSRIRDTLRRIALDSILDCEDLRARFTRVLHDELGQALTVLNLHLFWLSRHCPGDTEISGKIGEMQQIVSSTNQAIAQVARDCRPLLNSPEATLADIVECVIRRYRVRRGFDCELRMQERLPALRQDGVVAVAYLLTRCFDLMAARNMRRGLRIEVGCRDGICTIGISDVESAVRETGGACAPPDLHGIATIVEALGGTCVPARVGPGEFGLRIALPLPREDVRYA